MRKDLITVSDSEYRAKYDKDNREYELYSNVHRIGTYKSNSIHFSEGWRTFTTEQITDLARLAHKCKVQMRRHDNYKRKFLPKNGVGKTI